MIYDMFENLRFHPSTQNDKPTLSKGLHSGKRCRKHSFGCPNTLFTFTCERNDMAVKKLSVFKNIRIYEDEPLADSGR